MQDFLLGNSIITSQGYHRLSKFSKMLKIDRDLHLQAVQQRPSRYWHALFSARSGRIAICGVESWVSQECVSFPTSSRLLGCPLVVFSFHFLWTSVWTARPPPPTSFLNYIFWIKFQALAPFGPVRACLTRWAFRTSLSGDLPCPLLLGSITKQCACYMCATGRGFPCFPVGTSELLPVASRSLTRPRNQPLFLCCAGSSMFSCSFSYWTLLQDWYPCCD